MSYRIFEYLIIFAYIGVVSGVNVGRVVHQKALQLS